MNKTYSRYIAANSYFDKGVFVVLIENYYNGLGLFLGYKNNIEEYQVCSFEEFVQEEFCSVNLNGV